MVRLEGQYIETVYDVDFLRSAISNVNQVIRAI